MSKTERRRLTTDVYGLITTEEAGYQVVCDLTRGTLLEIERGARGPARVRGAGRTFLPSATDLLRIERASAPAA